MNNFVNMFMRGEKWDNFLRIPRAINARYYRLLTINAGLSNGANSTATVSLQDTIGEKVITTRVLIATLFVSYYYIIVSFCFYVHICAYIPWFGELKRPNVIFEQDAVSKNREKTGFKESIGLKKDYNYVYV